MFIRSERLFLRPGWPEDWNELLSQDADEGTICNLASAPWPYTADAAREGAAQPQSPRYPYFMITLPGSEGSRLIGAIGLARLEGLTELGCWIVRDQWNRGYATEAGRAVLMLARTLGHRQIAAHHFADNPASGRVLGKLGFTATGRAVSRWSLGRGCEAPAERLTVELSAPNDCDGGNSPAMRAA